MYVPSLVLRLKMPRDPAHHAQASHTGLCGPRSSSCGSLGWGWSGWTYYYLWLCGLATGEAVTVYHHRLPGGSYRTDLARSKGYTQECVHQFCSHSDLSTLAGNPQTTWPSMCPGLQYTLLAWTRLPSSYPPWTGRES